MRLQFLGATETVTGSKFHLSNDSHAWLIDCGLFQGLKELRRRNWHPLPIHEDALSAVLLTHAHIDHSGFLPVLVNRGFVGPILTSEPTVELCKILLPDAGYIQEEDARYAAKGGYSKHRQPLPLYTYDDAIRSLQNFQAIPDRTWHALSNDVRIMLRPAGHILGARFINVSIKEGRRRFNVLFAGDIGRYDSLITTDPGKVKTVDYLVMESTYGDHLHPDEDVFAHFAEIIHTTVARGGKILIPAFAVGRTQQILYILRRLEDTGRLPDIPIYLNSPLSIDATAIYSRYLHEHSFSQNGTALAASFHPSRLIEVHEATESKRLNRLAEPAIILASSGMMTGGRILHHLKSYLPDPRSTLILSGFQAAGTRGRAVLDGAKAVKIHGQPVVIRAQVEPISSLSAHGDWRDILRWLGGFERPPRTTFLVHGEPPSAQALKARIEKELGWKVVIPKYLDKVEL